MTEGFFLRTYRLASSVAAASARFVSLLPGRRSRRHALRTRLGRLDPETIEILNGGPALWVHAASVGELNAVRPLLGRLRDRYPDRLCIVTTLTETGLDLARQLPEVHAAFLFPIDAVRVVRRLLSQLRLEGFLFTETEIWPTLLMQLEADGIPAIMVSGRVSDRSMRRTWLLRPLYRRALTRVVCCMQTVEDASRIIALGADSRLVHVAGSLKFDVPTAPQIPEIAPFATALRSEERRTIVAGSTHDGEETVLLDAFRRITGVHSNVTLLVAPRRPDRFNTVAGMAASAGFRTFRYSQMVADGTQLPADGAAVVVLDVMGLLAHCYQLGVIAFVGGTLVPVGGHNVIEPARAGKPVIVGPHTANVAAIVDRLVAGGGGVRVRSGDLLAVAIDHLLAEPLRALEMGRRARELVQREQGALERHAKIIAARLGTATFARSPAES